MLAFHIKLYYFEKEKNNNNMAARMLATSIVSYFKDKPFSKRTWKLVTGCWTSEKRRPLSTSPDCATPIGPIAHYDSLVRSGLLLEDSLQKAALWQLEKLHGEMARYTNLPLSPPENGKDSSLSDKVSKISKPAHRVKTEETVKDVSPVASRKEEEECGTEKVSVWNGNKSCHTDY
ncbi:hypothetical protein PDJAM_G00194580 [Pangasius djambal]|uniref:Uncharacterized protein n=1 Tax=Pangasius djambal TaxID=1691987 RepID=A0ACC5ZPE4_9TELE|nr:hypothetical protein [Pangasius djambal]